MQPIHPLRYGAVNAADEAQDSTRAKFAQIPQSGAALPSVAVTPDTGETPAELIRNAATILTTAGSYGRITRYANTDVFAVRELLARAVALLESKTGDVTETFTLTAQGRHALARSVNDRGPLAAARHLANERQRAWERFCDPDGFIGVRPIAER